jgi:hypothetical protein
MRRVALAILAAAPLAASAQWMVIPAPPSAPPPVMVVPRPPPQPVVLVPRQPPPPPPALSPFYFKLSVGYGASSLYWPYGYGSGWGYGWVGAGGLAYGVEGGVRLAPPLLLGLDLEGVTAFGNSWEGTPSTTSLNYDAVLTIFPFVRGFYLKAGGGLSTLTVTFPWSPGVTYVGSNVLLGTGWAIPVAPPVHLTLGVDWTWQFFGNPDVTDASIWLFKAGIGFY